MLIIPLVTIVIIIVVVVVVYKMIKCEIIEGE